jgi:hypothetical protein
MSAWAWVSGCGAGQLADPKTTVKQYARALEEGRADAAYALLSNEARRGTSLAAFRKVVAESPEEARELGRSLGRPSGQATVTAVVTTESGERLEMVLEQGAWKVDASAIDIYPQDSPRHAISTFVLAFERKRYDILVKLVPTSKKEGLTPAVLKEAWEGPEKAEVTKVVQSVKAALMIGAIEQTGVRASMVYDLGVLQLVREDNRWKIEDYQLAAP